MDLTLTSKPLGKNFRVPLAGIPHHAADGYIARLVARGYRVAIADQLSDEPAGKGLMPRAVTRVVTPGTIIEEAWLAGRENSYLVAAVCAGDRAGLARIDVSTGEFVTQELAASELRDELLRIRPRELLAVGDLPPCEEIPSPVPLRAETLDAERAEEELQRHFGTATLAAFGCAGKPLAICAAAAILRYLRENQPAVLASITRLATAEPGAWMTLDPQTIRNLELFSSNRGGKGDALIDVLDRTRTPMGGRLLRQRLARPLLEPAAIERRLDEVAWFAERETVRARALGLLGRTSDIERLTTRCCAGAATVRDLHALRAALQRTEELRELLAHAGAEATLPALPSVAEIETLLGAALGEAPGTIGQGDVFRPGFCAELDELREAASGARGFLAALEARERERTGIRSLKVGYNRVFGYYIEVSHANAAAVPADYQRRQTLTGAERYVTPELKAYEERVLSAQERLEEVEGRLFRQLCATIAAHGETLRAAAAAIAAIDVAAALAETAVRNDYCRPRIRNDGRLVIRAGRHPVVELRLPPGAFVPNDTVLDDDAQIIVLTGPNMAGKSTYLRQVALIVLMAQIGSYVPAREAEIGVVDRIFTRVGAQDDLAAGASTFMVEMVETAHILHHCTPRSLVVLDEVGRGTSTYDGLAIAQAVVEYLHNHRESAAKTLFATHYHELTALAATLPRVRNFTVAVGEEDGRIVFLRTIIPGGADRSYGIHVAQLAGLPRAVVQRASAILADLEERAAGRTGRSSSGRRRTPAGQQLSLFDAPPALIAELAALDVDALTPLDALRLLYELREKARSF